MSDKIVLERREQPLPKAISKKNYNNKQSIYINGKVILLSKNTAKFVDSEELKNDKIYQNIRSRMSVEKEYFEFTILQKENMICHDKSGNLCAIEECFDKIVTMYLYVCKGKNGQFRVIVDKIKC